MGRWRAVIVKELLLLGRDVHALMVLFVMPVVFILIMSLAMRDEFASHSELRFDVHVVNRDGGALSQRALASLGETSTFRLIPATEGGEGELTHLRRAVEADREQFLLWIPPDYFARFEEDEEGPPGEAIRIYIAPSVRKPIALLLEAAVKEAVAKVHLNQFLRELQVDLGKSVESAERVAEEEEILAADAIERVYVGGAQPHERPPSSVQQNVPAWLVFSMFFLVIPISTTFITERQQGTLGRLRSMNISVPLLFTGKLIPYFLINQVQVVTMLLVGVFLVPLLGGDVLTLGHSLAGLGLMATAVSFGAIGYALLISVLARTTEQATTLGGVGNIVLAAIGGIMVPKFVMPEAMQGITVLSPMAWGLEGFLDILLRQGGVREVLPEATALLVFGFAALLMATQLLRRRA